MIYQPTFPSPYMQTIDANAVEGNVFKCLINPKNTIYEYKLLIKDVNGNFVAGIHTFVEDSVQKKYIINATLKPPITTPRYVNGNPVAAIENQNQSIYTMTEIEVSEKDSLLPFKGSLNDEAWLCIDIPYNIGLANNKQYTWSLSIPSIDENKTLLFSGDVNGDAGFIYNGSTIAGLKSGSTIISCNYLSADVFDGLLYGFGWFFPAADGSYKRIMGVPQYTWVQFSPETLFLDIYSSNKTQRIYSYQFTQTPDYYFTTRTTPTLEFNVPEVITSLSHNFTATYSQEQSSSVSYYKFELYSEGKLIDETEEMYSSDISYTYGGLLNGKTYTIKLTVVDENGFELNEERTFDVAYETYQSYAEPKVSFNYEKSCIDIDYSAYANIDGEITNGEATYKNFLQSDGTTSEEPNGISLAYNQELSWDNASSNPLNLDDASIILHWHADRGFTGTIVELEDLENYRRNVKVWYDGLQFHYTLGTLPEITYSPYTGGTESAISDGTVAVDETKAYVLNDEDVLQDTDVLVDYDIVNEFWWYIVITPLEVKFIQSTRYSDTEVTE